MAAAYRMTVTYGGSQQSTVSVPNQEFEQFADLTKKLLTVPKSEVDKKRKKKDS